MIQHLSELVWDSHIGWVAVPGASKLFTIAPMVLLYQSLVIAVTPMAGRNALLGSGSLLKLLHLRLHSATSNTLLRGFLSHASIIYFIT